MRVENGGQAGQMFLHDSRLQFARDLIGHWLQIRHGALVPAEEDLDPRELWPWFKHLAICDISTRGTVEIELAGAAMRQRYGRDLRRVNWLELVPPVLGDGDGAHASASATCLVAFTTD